MQFYKVCKEPFEDDDKWSIELMASTDEGEDLGPAILSFVTEDEAWAVTTACKHEMDPLTEERINAIVWETEEKEEYA